MKSKKKLGMFIDQNGHNYFAEYYCQLSQREREKFMALMMQIQEVNLLIAQRQLWIRRVKRDFYELRCYIDKGIIHCAYFFVTDDEYVLTHAYLKTDKEQVHQEQLVAEKLQQEWRFMNAN
ncbi:type II toxin-antitoxin system RelE/ParE family toxin [Periweissella fabaria]|uniref:Type II toxin-antitoxin system RelE/ParE family toxin n=1 Tax=Periweissella fabaria TaxID=546157 RepID=A0ABM8Z6S7_9LACO|nr:type II toxin-antitoxin system RelE/ParE family toxin [Periweissella fabaria]MCM0596617.1 type II toxin-antitoxin system RelE/ParE family toxin [Periweissella fabaria]CAH0416458.1 hypothetical protein WFA24289_00762 [Periweissella fabaria]